VPTENCLRISPRRSRRISPPISFRRASPDGRGFRTFSSSSTTIASRLMPGARSRIGSFRSPATDSTSGAARLARRSGRPRRPRGAEGAPARTVPFTRSVSGNPSRDRNRHVTRHTGRSRSHVSRERSHGHTQSLPEPGTYSTLWLRSQAAFDAKRENSTASRGISQSSACHTGRFDAPRQTRFII
jgi:hypothetical protein